MRILIDMQGAQTESRYRGIGRYTLAFAQAVIRNRGEHEVFLALSGLFPDTIEPIRAAFDDLLPQENIRVWHAPGPVKAEHPANDVRRQTAELIREAFFASLQPDVIHITSLFEGYVDDAVTSIGRFDRTTPVSVSLYDLIPLLNPDQYLTPNPRYATYYQRKIAALKEAKLLLAISDYSRKEGLLALECSSDRIVNVSTAIDEEFQPKVFTPAESAALLSRIGITRAVVLYTGGADERNHLSRLIEAWAALPTTLRQAHQLVFVGRIPESDIAEFRRISHTHGLQADELLFSRYINDEQLVQLYNLCKLCVFPSWHEGFALSVLEAMACGAPVIGANISSLPEVIGMEESLCDFSNVAAMVKKMAEVLQDENFRSRLREHGMLQAHKLSSDTTAQRAVTAWEVLLSAQPSQRLLTPPAGQKPKLAFVSPLPPERTGIADYSAELLPALAAYYDIELVVTQERVDASWGNCRFGVRSVDWLLENAKSIDRVLYQIGNSPFHQHMLSLLEAIPGTVVLHDFYLGHLRHWMEVHIQPYGWRRAIYDSHGYDALRESYRDVNNATFKFPVNWNTLQHAQGVIVHSAHSCNLAEQWYGSRTANDWMVIPLLRSPAGERDKPALRKQLGLDVNDFVVCSFGFLGATKLNHRLLQAWLKSALTTDTSCHLIFVGENPGGDYGASLLNAIRASGLVGDRIRITGFASPELFRQYLAVANLAVQLRTNSRGETSAAVLDCMNYGLPLIVNANGSMAELDTESVYMLPDEFDDDELTHALEVLWRDPGHRHSIGKRASAIIHDRHAPEKCAGHYAAAIELFHQRSATSTPALINAIAFQENFAPDEPSLIRLSSALAATLPLPQSAKRLFLDVTATCRYDLKTGIERVARALMLALLESPPAGYRIEPVYLTDTGGAWHYRYARCYTLGLLGCPTEALMDEPVLPVNGDVLLTLDLSGSILIQAEKAGLFSNYREQGVLVYATVFDLLPLQLPENFPSGADQNHQLWLEAISQFNGAVCISKAVADDFRFWQDATGFKCENRRPFSIDWFHLGADVTNSAPSRGLPKNAEATLQKLKAFPSFLMVGTIEPRKGYLQTFEAFEQLWREGAEVNLVIVGHEGWKSLTEEMRRDIPQTVERLRTHPELNKRLFWLEGITDEYLEKIYAASNCLIAASYGEGFGLPLIEAAQHQLPIIARNIPVFREVAGEHAFYFDTVNPEGLALCISEWLSLYTDGKHPQSLNITWLTWKKSAARLMQHVLERNTVQLAL